MQNYTFQEAAAALSEKCNQYGLTAEAKGTPRAETRENNWDCVSWEMAYKHAGREIHAGKFSQGLGHFKVPDFYKRECGCYDKNLTLRYKGAAQWYENMARRKTPTEDALRCFVQDSYISLYRLTFADFCAECGYSDDSIKARETYDAVREEGDRLIGAIGEAKARELYEIASQI